MSQKPHILLVDDEASIREPLAEYLESQQYRVTAAESAARARTFLRDHEYDIVLLDIMMPGEDGLSLCRHIAESKDIPVIFLTAKGKSMDRIIGLEIGGDDYVTKPFDPRELVARIKTILRRMAKSQNIQNGQHAKNGQNAQKDRLYHFAGWTLDIVRQRLTNADNVLVPISSAECKLLAVFVEHPEQVLNRDQLLDMAHGREAHLFDRAIDNQISRLRKKIEQDSRNPELITTIWGGGYCLAVKVTTSERAPEKTA